MKTTAGLWLDHRKAVIVILSDEGEIVKEITSNMEKHIRYSGSSHSKTLTEPGDASESGRDRRFANQLNQYYDDVIACLRDAESILIFGSGEAKGELQKRLENDKSSKRIVGIDTVDKMTDRQIAAKVREYFRENSAQ